MQELKTEKLLIKVEHQSLPRELTRLIWIGTSDWRDPAPHLNPFLSQAVQLLVGKTIEVDLTKLVYINSATIPVIMSFIRELEINCISTTIFYSENNSFQNTTFSTFQMLSKILTYVKISPRQ
jgi:ABC-type transporter Mla MlaB component